MHRFKKIYVCIWVIKLNFRNNFWRKMVIKNDDNSDLNVNVYKVGVMMNNSKTITHGIIADFLNPT